jgi:geranylgeranyl pyrophosphate synthase
MANVLIPAHDIGAVIKADASDISRFLSDYFSAMDCDATRLQEAMAYASLNGGKRIRASLTLSAARLVDQDSEDARNAAIIAAAAIEMVHAYSLVHDDLPAMDDADTRRAMPSAHIQFDEATAILAGDALQTEAFALLADPQNGIAAERAIMLVHHLAKASGLTGMAGGQMLDLQADIKAKEGMAFTVEQTELMQKMKTGALIIAAPVMGAVAAGGSETIIKDLEAYAAPLGLAFQIADDVLDVTADNAVMGKPVGRDKDQGKASFVDFYGLEGAQKMAADLMTQSVDALSSYGEKAAELHQIAHFVINRSH